MAPRKTEPEGSYIPQGINHYNVCFKAGHILNRVRQRDLCEFRHQDIEWVWIVEANGVRRQMRSRNCASLA